MCWAPECTNVPAPSRGTRPSRYCSPRCRVRAVRRNGGKAPTEPYPPYPLHQDAPAVTVAVQSERIRDARNPLTPQSSDAGGKARKARRDSVHPPAVVATAGTAPAPTAPPQGSAVPPEAADPPLDKAPVEQPPAGSDKQPGVSDQLMQRPDSEGLRTPPETPGYPASSPEDLDPKAPTVPVTVPRHPMVEAYRRDLDELGQLGTREGEKILEMAGKLVSASSSPAASATISKELDRLMTELEAKTKPVTETDGFNVIRERTLRKLGIVGVRDKLPA